jgi:phosphatidylinositol alpha-1,6-mannosyltransferase
MNILVVGFNFGLIGGLEIVSKAIAAAAATRHRVQCIALNESGITREPGYEIVGLLPANRVMRSLSHRLPGLFGSADLRPHFASADVVIFAHAHTLKAAMPVLSAMETPPATVCWLHGREVWGGMGKEHAGFLGKVDRLVAVSHYTAEVVQGLMPGHMRAEVIHNPVDTGVFTPLDVTAGEQVRRHTIMTVGRHDPDSFHKGYDVLIDTMAMLRDRRPDLPLQLVITGTGELVAQHRAQIERLALGDRVVLAGRVSRSELRKLYRTTDVFAFPSRVAQIKGEEYGEGFGVVNVEAAACGRPVVTSSHGGCPETVIDGETGFVIDPTSVASVAAAIERLFDVSAEARDDMGRRGRQMAIERFSAAVFQNRVLATIESACPFPSSRSVPLP